MKKMEVYAVMRGWEGVEIKGPDAKDYLQRMSSADFRFLKAGEFSPGTLLQSTGRIALYFKALNLGGDRYLLLVPADPGSQAPASQSGFETLEKFHFRENFAIQPLGQGQAYLRILGADLNVAKRLAEALGMENNADFEFWLKSRKGAFLAARDGWLMNEGRWCAEPLRYDFGLVISGEKLEAAEKALSGSGFSKQANLNGFRLRAGEPDSPGEINSAVLPLESALVDAVHENKGCYPGQEVVERIRSMGQVPRKLALLRGTGPVPQVPTPILVDADAGPIEAGILTSADADPLDSGWVGLGFIKRVLAKPDSSYRLKEQPVSQTQFVERLSFSALAAGAGSQ